LPPVGITRICQMELQNDTLAGDETGELGAASAERAMRGSPRRRVQRARRVGYFGVGDWPAARRCRGGSIPRRRAFERLHVVAQGV
jgi:hypothetical protein